MRLTILIAAILALSLPATAAADDLLKTIEADLSALGYDTGPVDGEKSVETEIAISQFQADNNLPVTGEASPQLAGVIKSKMNGAPVAAAQPMTEAERQAAEQSCLERKIEEARTRQKQKKGFMSLVRTVTNAASRYGGNSEVAQDVVTTSREISKANATINDVQQTARDLGVSEDDIEACKQP